MITRQIVRNKILAYLNREITLAELVDWAEDGVFETDLDENDTELLMSILGRLGAADVEQFALSWDDYFAMLSQLGYKPQVITA
jgi:hypothetical protein